MKQYAVFLVASILALSIITSAEIYLKETFSDADWEKVHIYIFLHSKFL
jgi:hypothetical protein